ncbi:beta-carotene 15,15'-monooxygenase [Cytobacillus kochii]|uniref:beta-carotene 15,15'-monooxygenase n=1 Tax=Cytobacillus kochii TaxID=859143 RepID=UPI00402A7EF5
MKTISKGKYLWLFLLLAVLFFNTLLYQTSVGALILPANAQDVVLGSLIDFMIMLPLFFMLYKGKFSLKSALLLCASGCLLARLIIPAKLLAPYSSFVWGVILIEVIFISLELLLIVTFIKYMPKIIKEVKQSSLPTVFSYSYAVDHYTKKYQIIRIVCSECLMFYYAFASWKKTPREGITLYKNSSYIAFQIMLIHAILIETIAIHWLIHQYSIVLSKILFISNVYAVIFFIGDIQAMKLNPIYYQNGTLYLSLGLVKRVVIPIENIKTLMEEKSVLQGKLSKDTVEFMTRDLEKVYPDIILELKEPVHVTYFMGFKKAYKKVAIRSDSPLQLKEWLTL